jgi:hypothetical protein
VHSFIQGVEAGELILRFGGLDDEVVDVRMFHVSILQLKVIDAIIGHTCCAGDFLAVLKSRQVFTERTSILRIEVPP